MNPKMKSNFNSKIEEVAYKYLGIEKPTNRLSEIEVDTVNHELILPNMELEQVSPDSEKCSSIEPSSPSKHLLNENNMNDVDDKIDDLESPAFEPIECKTVKDESLEHDDDRMDICNSSDSDNEPIPPNGFGIHNSDEVKSNLSSISGLTSNESIESNNEQRVAETVENKGTIPIKTEGDVSEVEQTSQHNPIVEKKPPSSPEEAVIQHFDAVVQPEEKPSIHYTNDVVENLNQDSVLSQVSSNSRLSIITNNNTNTRNDDENDDKSKGESACPLGISEEAQMQRFNDSSSSNSLIIDTANTSNQDDEKKQFVAAFDIKKEEIKFVGTERKSFDIDLHEFDEKRPSIADQIESNFSMKHSAETPDTIIASCSETSKDIICKSEDISSVSTTDTSNRIEAAVTESMSNDVNSRSEDSKCLDESSSLSSRHKDTKSSSHRNGGKSNEKTSSKDRHSSSSSRHGSHSKRSNTSNNFSSSRDRSRKDVSDGKHHRSDERSDKSHHKSSSGSTRSGDDNSRSSSSKSYKDHRSDRKESRSHGKDSKRDSKYSDAKKSRSESHRSSHREKDDHASHKEKPTSRRRSRSKDSNDGSAGQNGVRNQNAPTNIANANQHEQTNVQESDPVTPVEQQSETATCLSNTLKFVPPLFTDVMNNELVDAPQPVVVDQILSGKELNLEVFIDENRDNPLVSSIEQTLINHAKVQKPKMAANIHEARKFMKIRKQINREEQKKLEQARVLAKQYMRSNLTSIVGDNQGVELEFACVNNSDIPGPSISSPAKFVGDETDLNNAKLITSLASSTATTTVIDTARSSKSHQFYTGEAGVDFDGFSMDDLATASENLKHFGMMNDGAVSLQATAKSHMKKLINHSTHINNKLIPNDQFIEMMSSNEDRRPLLLDNDSPIASKVLNVRKRKCPETIISTDTTEKLDSLDNNEMASVVAKVIITPKSDSAGRNGKRKTHRFRNSINSGMFHLQTCQHWINRGKRHVIPMKICSNPDRYWVVHHVHGVVALTAMIRSSFSCWTHSPPRNIFNILSAFALFVFAKNMNHD